MSIPQTLQVIVELALTSYILGLVVSFIASRVMEALETRGLPLERYFHLRSIAAAKAYAFIDLKGAQADFGPLLKDLGDLSFKVGWW